MKKLLCMPLGIALCALGIMYGQAVAASAPQEWNLVNPSGVIKKAEIKPAQRLTSLDGKTVALRWNGKHNGDIALNRLAELLQKKFPNAKILKTYADNTENLNVISGNPAESARIAKAVAATKPDLVIAAQAD